MKEKQALIYWLDTTGPWEYDEIVRLTIIDINNDIFFDHVFNTKLVDWWYGELNGIKPEETYKEQSFEKYKHKIQNIFNSANKLITFYGSTSFLQKQGVDLVNIQIHDVADDFRVMGDDTDTIDNLSAYYGYDLPTNIYERSGIDCAKAVNFCYKKMERYRRAQEKQANKKHLVIPSVFVF